MFSKPELVLLTNLQLFPKRQLLTFNSFSLCAKEQSLYLHDLPLKHIFVLVRALLILSEFLRISKALSLSFAIGVAFMMIGFFCLTSVQPSSVICECETTTGVIIGEITRCTTGITTFFGDTYKTTVATFFSCFYYIL